MTLRDVMDGLPTKVVLVGAGQTPVDSWMDTPEVVSVTLAFSEKGFGFGEVTVKQTKDGVFINTEMMGPDKVKQYLAALVEQAVLDTDDDPEKHLKYNEVMGRTCACPRCMICSIKLMEEIEQELGQRLGLSGDIRLQLIELATAGKLIEDELVSEWHALYAQHLEWSEPALVEDENQGTD